MKNFIKDNKAILIVIARIIALFGVLLHWRNVTILAY